MNTTKCDLCKKEIKDKTIRIGYGFWVDYVELCEECSLPVVEFLKEKKLTKVKN